MLSTLLLVVIAAAPAPMPATAPSNSAPPTQQQIRASVERSLVFLDKSGTDWWTKSKCASCHHVPMSIWSLSEAKQRGFKIDDASLDQLRTWAVPSYADHAKMKPAPQDGEEKGMSLNTIYLTQATASTGPLDAATTAALRKFAVHMLDAQDPDGSWKSSATLPPVGDVTEVRTMQVLLALASAHDKGLVDVARWAPTRDRALAWLAKNKVVDQNQSWNLRLLVAKRFGKPDDVQTLITQLTQQQNDDGGWSQTKQGPTGPLKEYEEEKPKAAADSNAKEATSSHLTKSDDKKPAAAGQAPAEVKIRPSDALATGQTLYALTVAGVDARQPSIQRAQAFLVGSQTKDGSWLVPFRAQKNSGRALSHYGTGWAAIGLMQTLDTPPAGSVGSRR